MAAPTQGRADPRARLVAALLAIALALLGLAVAGLWPAPEEREESRRAALVRLGRELFFDPALSESRGTSCATCHVPERSFTDGRRFSPGDRGRPTKRNTPTLLNRPAGGSQFWDGRARSLVDQVAHPLENPDEMGRSIERACREIERQRRHGRLFRAAFGDRAVTPGRVSRAVAAFVGTLRATESDFERWRAAGAVPEEVERGKALFDGKARCAECHPGPDFTDERFHNTGVAWKSSGDPGRGGLTGRDEDTRAFKTPTLRELLRTGPFMHDGSLATLEAVVAHYAAGGSPLDPHLDPRLRPVRLSAAERADLLAFLEALSDSRGPAFRSPGPGTS